MEQNEGFRVEYNDDHTFLGGRMGIEVSLATPAAIDIDVLRECFNTAGGTLHVIDARGQPLASHDIPAGIPGWDIAATVHLEPGASTLRFEPDTDGDACFILLPAGSPRP
jgi:hypothetical protein